MNTRSIFPILTILATVFLAGCTLIQTSSPSAKVPIADTSPQITFSEAEYDFGVVKQSGGIVSHDFAFTYSGSAPLTITGTPGSCACTTGSTNHQSYQPGESGILTVVLDPNLHAEPEDRFFKTVSILTEPAISPAPEVKIWAEIELDLGSEAYKLKEEHIK